MDNKVFTKLELPTVKNIIAIASGKGGVGKSTVAANLALAFAQNGYKTALVDADLFGPSVPTLFKLEGQNGLIEQYNDKQLFIPIEKFGIKLMSVGFLIDSEQALIWRGPMASNMLLQLFKETYWGDIDYMIIDLPPGTGDIPITLCQQVDIKSVIIVTTPESLAFVDVQKSITMFKNTDLSIPICGIVENMSWFTPVEHPDEKYFLFGKNGGKMLAEKFNIELLMQIPLVLGMSELSDKGNNDGHLQNELIKNMYHNLLKKILVKLKN